VTLDEPEERQQLVDGAMATARSTDAAGSAAFRRRPAEGGGVLGTGIGADASLLGRLAARPGAFLSRTARRLTGPRTGARGTKTQPTWGTGLPPMSRPSSNSQG